MHELLRSNDLVFLSFIEAALKADGVESLILDQAMSATEGSILAIPRRLMVHPDDKAKAEQILADVRSEYGD